MSEKKKQRMSRKECLAFDIIDEYDNCVSGEPCNAELVRQVFIRGFESGRLEASERVRDLYTALHAIGGHASTKDLIKLRKRIESIGEEE